MRPGHYAFAVVLAAAAAIGGCESNVTSVTPKAPTKAVALAGGESFVKAGTQFSVQTNQPLDTYFTTPGTSFTATVVDPLFSQDGRLVVPYGALLRGRVVSVGPYERPRLQIQFDSIDTAHGPAHVEASLRHSQHYVWAGPDPLEMNTSVGPEYDFRYGPNASRRLPSPDLFSYHDDYGYDTQQPREIHVPRGAILELSLSAPLALPR